MQIVCTGRTAIYCEFIGDWLIPCSCARSTTFRRSNPLKIVPGTDQSLNAIRAVWPIRNNDVVHCPQPWSYQRLRQQRESLGRPADYRPTGSDSSGLEEYYVHLQ